MYLLLLPRVLASMFFSYFSLQTEVASKRSRNEVIREVYGWEAQLGISDEFAYSGCKSLQLGQYEKEIPILERSIEVPVLEEWLDHALVTFAKHMWLGDTYAMLGQLENYVECYKSGLEIQKQVLGEIDLRFGETYRYLVEAHVQEMQFMSLTPREVRRVSNGCLLRRHAHGELTARGGQEKHTVDGNNEEGSTSLHSAMSSGHANFVEALL
jgi:tetratricopeptide (TPR) repeat protein